MSIECAYCERDLRGGHASDCDRPRKAARKRAVNPNPLEKDIEAKIGQYAKSKGCLWKKWSSPGQRGVPDRIIVTPAGVVGFLELKRGGKEPSPLQTSELKALKKHGACVGWCDNVEDGCEFIDELLKHKPLFQVITDAGWFQATA